MNGLPPPFYLPVFVREKKARLVFLAPELEAPLARAFALFDAARGQAANDKITQFMFGLPSATEVPARGEIRALEALPCPMEEWSEREEYERWLADKAILRTERFFGQRPTWNFASTRHFLLGDFQFKGVGTSAASGRVDFEHSHGRLEVYEALLETVVSWQLHRHGLVAQRVAALWHYEFNHKTYAVMLREARAPRLAQLAGVVLTEQEKHRLLVRLKQNTFDELLGLATLRYAELFVSSWEILSPTYDNLLLDGSIVDAVGVRHSTSKGFGLSLCFRSSPLGLRLLKDPFEVYERVLRQTHEVLCALGAHSTWESVLAKFWRLIDERLGAVGTELKVLRELLQTAKHAELGRQQWPELLAPGIGWGETRWSAYETSRYVPAEKDVEVLVIESAPTEATRSPYRLADQALALLQDGEVDAQAFSAALRRML